MYHDCKTIETDLNERLKNLVSKLTFKAINWKIKMIEGDLAGANKDFQEIERVLEQMKMYLSPYKLH